MKKSILTIGLGVLLSFVGFSQSTTTKTTTESNSEATTLQPRDVKIIKSVQVTAPTKTVSVKSKAVTKAEAIKPVEKAVIKKTEK